MLHKELNRARREAQRAAEAGTRLRVALLGGGGGRCCCCCGACAVPRALWQAGRRRRLGWSKARQRPAAVIAGLALHPSPSGCS